MPFAIDDGFTLSGETKPIDGETVKFQYRPALWPALNELRRAVGLATEVEVVAKFIVDHVMSWDVLMGKGPAPITADTVRKLPEPILNDMYGTISTWCRQKKADAEGN